MGDPPRLMIAAGEASGDHHAARVLRALREQGVDAVASGMGGPELAAAGMEIRVDCRDMAIVGIIEVIRHWCRIRANLGRLQEDLRNRRPDLLILVDYPDFNLKLARTAHDLGIPVLYYISPQVWAWRAGRVKKIARLVDMMIVLFPFEEQLYKRAGVPVRYVGHPLVDEVQPSASPTGIRERLGVAPDETVIGLLPGSRSGEIQRLLPLFLDTARAIERERGSTRFLLPLAGTLDAAPVRATIAAHGAPVEIIEGGRVHDVLQICDAVVAASGTITLEAALMRTPMTVVYRVNWLTFQIARWLVRITDIALVNIVAGRRIVTEYVQDAATPAHIARETLRLLDDRAYRERVIAGLDEVRTLLGEGGAPGKAATVVRAMLPQRTIPR